NRANEAILHCSYIIDVASGESTHPGRRANEAILHRFFTKGGTRGEGTRLRSCANEAILHRSLINRRFPGLGSDGPTWRSKGRRTNPRAGRRCEAGVVLPGVRASWLHDGDGARATLSSTTEFLDLSADHVEGDIAMRLAALLISVGIATCAFVEGLAKAPPVLILGTFVDADGHPTGSIGADFSDFNGRSGCGEIVGRTETDAQGRFRLEVPVAAGGGPEPGPAAVAPTGSSTPGSSAMRSRPEPAGR